MRAISSTGSAMRVLCLLGYLMVLINNADGCSCWRISRKKKYCKAEFVVEAKVLSPLINHNGMQDFDDFYSVEVMSQIKMTNQTAVNLSRIYTATNGALCGVYLEEGQTYYLGGEIEKKRRLFIDLCQSLVFQSGARKRKPKLFRKPPACW